MEKPKVLATNRESDYGWSSWSMSGGSSLSLCHSLRWLTNCMTRVTSSSWEAGSSLQANLSCRLSDNLQIYVRALACSTHSKLLSSWSNSQK